MLIQGQFYTTPQSSLESYVEYLTMFLQIDVFLNWISKKVS